MTTRTRTGSPSRRLVLPSAICKPSRGTSVGTEGRRGDVKRVERRAERRSHASDTPVDLAGRHQRREPLPQSLDRPIAGQAVQLHRAAVGDVAPRVLRSSDCSPTGRSGRAARRAPPRRAAAYPAARAARPSARGAVDWLRCGTAGSSPARGEREPPAGGGAGAVVVAMTGAGGRARNHHAPPPRRRGQRHRGGGDRHGGPMRWRRRRRDPRWRRVLDRARRRCRRRCGTWSPGHRRPRRAPPVVSRRPKSPRRTRRRRVTVLRPLRHRPPHHRIERRRGTSPKAATATAARCSAPYA